MESIAIFGLTLIIQAKSCNHEQASILYMSIPSKFYFDLRKYNLKTNK